MRSNRRHTDLRDPALVVELLLESAAGMARSLTARSIVVAADALPEGTPVPEGTIVLVRRDGDERLAASLGVGKEQLLEVPSVELDRLGQIKLAALIAVSRRVLDLQDTVIFLSGPYGGLVDTMVVMHLGSECELIRAADQPSIDEHVKRAVFQRVLDLALHLGAYGREGRSIGAMLVVGDTAEVQSRSEQMILNPFQGYDAKKRNIMDPRMTETIREYSQLDGAIVIRGSGVVESAGTRVLASSSHPLEAGLGARHAAAAGITASTKAIAITVSATDGTVRVWRAGRMVASLEPGPRA